MSTGFYENNVYEPKYIEFIDCTELILCIYSIMAVKFTKYNYLNLHSDE